jgi:hypothetical protein
VIRSDRFVGRLVEAAIITGNVRRYRRLQTVDLPVPRHLRFIRIRPTANITAKVTIGQGPVLRPHVRA